jgi:hypothetical protein
MDSCGMIYRQNFMKLDTSLQAILRFWLGEFEGYNFGLLKTGIWEASCWNVFRLHETHTKFPDDLFMHLSNIPVIIVKIWEDEILLLLIDGTKGVRRWGGFLWHDRPNTLKYVHAFKQY